MCISTKCNGRSLFDDVIELVQWPYIRSLRFCLLLQNSLQSWQNTPHVFGRHLFLIAPQTSCSFAMFGVANHIVWSFLLNRSSCFFLGDKLHVIWFATIATQLCCVTIVAKPHYVWGAIRNKWHPNTASAFCHNCFGIVGGIVAIVPSIPNHQLWTGHNGLRCRVGQSP